MKTARKGGCRRPPAFSAPYMLGRAAMARSVENAAFAVGFASAAAAGAFAYLGFRCLEPGTDPTAMLCVSAAGLAVGAVSVVVAGACGLSFSRSMDAAAAALVEVAREMERRGGAGPSADGPESEPADPGPDRPVRSSTLAEKI